MPFWKLRQEFSRLGTKSLGICSCFVLVFVIPKLGIGKEAATWAQNH